MKSIDIKIKEVPLTNENVKEIISSLHYLPDEELAELLNPQFTIDFSNKLKRVRKLHGDGIVMKEGA